MCTERAWIACLIFAVVLLADGSSQAQQAGQEPVPPPMSEEERRKVLERLVKQMQDAQKGQTPGAAQAAPSQPPAPPSAPPAPAPAAAIPSVVRRAPLAGGQVQLSYDNADLFDFINQIAKDALGITPIVIDPEVKGTVTIQSSAPMSKEDVFPLFNIILKNNNAALVKEGDIYQIVPISSGLKKGLEVIEDLPVPPPAKPGANEPEKKPETAPAAPAKAGTPPPTGVPDPGTGPAALAPQTGSTPARPTQAAQGTQPQAQQNGTSAPRLATHVIRVEFVPVRDLIDPVKLFMTDGGVIMPYDRLNMLILTDYSDSVSKILEIVHMLDNNYLNPDLIELVRIQSNASADVLEDLKKIFGNGTKDSATGINFVSLDRLNAILVMANSKRALAEVKRWIKELDATTGRTVQTFVYTVENSTASNIAMILSALYGGEGGGTVSGGGAAGTSGAFGSAGRTGTMGGGLGTGTSFGGMAGGGTGGLFGGGTSGGGFTSAGSGAFQGAAGGLFGGGAVGGTQAGFGGYGGGAFGGGQQLGPRLNQQPTISATVFRGGGFSGLQDNVRVVVDDINNSLIIQATTPDYNFILDTIKKMDVLPRQAIIDARIFEVDLTDALSFGVSANLQGISSSTSPNQTTGQIDSGGALSVNTFAFVGNSREILMALSTLRTKTKVRVLEAPSVLALDGTEAHIVVGAEYPYPGTSFIGAAGGATSSVQYRDTGISLIVMPRISASGHVTLEIAQEVSSPGASITVGNGATAQSFNKTSVQTTLSVKDGETVAIAGLIRKNATSGRSGVPVLSEIPLVGALFGSTNNTATRSELLILITPHVIRTAERFQEMTQELKDSLRNVRRLVDTEDQEHMEDMKGAREENVNREDKRLKVKDSGKPEKSQTQPPPAENPKP